MAVNKGESIRLKFVSITNRFGFTVSRLRPAQTDDKGNFVSASKLDVVVLDVDTTRTFIPGYYDVGGGNQNNPDEIELLMPALFGDTPSSTTRPIIDEGDELTFNRYIHNVTRVKPLPISGTHVFYHLFMTRQRKV